MPSSSMNVVIRQLVSSSQRPRAGVADGDLLTCFLSHQDADALATLVQRHAAMVWGVCRRILGNPHDAEDAFQATFLVLVQKAATVMPRQMVANWLHGVAHQTAVRLRATATKRGAREMHMKDMPEPALAEARGDELLSLLDQELRRLPAMFRVIVILCDLEGKSRKEVARQLGCPEGTVASRLARARGMLAKRLARNGLAVSGGSLAAVMLQNVASACVPATVVSFTIKVATLCAAGKAAGVISIPVATLTDGVLKTMLLNKLMTNTMVALALGLAVTYCGLAIGQTASTPGGNEKPMVDKKPKPQTDEKSPKLENSVFHVRAGAAEPEQPKVKPVAKEEPVPAVVPVDPRSPKVRELRKERLGILRERLALTEKSYQAGNVSLTQYLDVKRVVLNAELELCETDKEQVAVLEKVIALAKNQEKIVLDAVQRGLASQSDAIDAKLPRIEAEIALELVRSKLAASK